MSPKPPGAITSPIRSRPRQHRSMSILSSEIAKHSPNDTHVYTMPEPDVNSNGNGNGNGSGNGHGHRSPTRTVAQSSNLKSLGGSSYNLDEFYASMKPSAQKKSPSQQKLFRKSPRSSRSPGGSPQIGSPTQRAAAEASDRRRSRSPRKTFDRSKAGSGSGGKAKRNPRDLKRQSSSKLQLLDDLLAQASSRSRSTTCASPPIY